MTWSGTPCLELNVLHRIAEGTYPASLLAEAERHLASCPVCPERLSEIWRALETDPVAAPVLPERKQLPARRWGALRQGAAAAAVLVVLGGAGGLFFWNRGRKADAAAPSRAWSGAVRTSRAETRELKLADGSRLILREETRIRLLPEAAGERVHVQLDYGNLEADAAKGAGRFLVSAPAGEVRVLGTCFRAKAFTLTPPGAGAAIPCLCVEVYEGSVGVRNASGDLRVEAGGRGLSLAGFGRPALGECRETCEDLIRAFAAKLEKNDLGDHALLLAATLWGRGGGWDWKRSLNPDSPAGLRKATELLVRMKQPEEPGKDAVE